MSFKLYYFNVRGTAELIRYIFAEAGQEYDDIRFERSEWVNHKQSMPMGKLPGLEYEGKRLGQSIAIARFVANKFNLTSTDEWERAEMDSWVDLYSEFINLCIKIHHEAHPSTKERFVNELKTKTKEVYLSLFEKALTDKCFLVGSNVSWADFAFLNMMEMLRGYKDKDMLDYDLASNFPNCASHMERISNRPNIAKWRKNRPVT